MKHPIVEVCYALPREQAVVKLRLAEAMTVGSAIEKSGLLERFAEIDRTTMRAGVFGKPRGLDDPVEAGDRVEIYRELSADPKEARRQRAARAKTR